MIDMQPTNNFVGNETAMINKCPAREIVKIEAL